MNGLPERMVQLFKASLKDKKNDPGTAHRKICDISANVSTYCLHTNTESTFNVILNTKSRIQLTKPNPEDIVNWNTTSKEELVRRLFWPGDEVLIRVYRKRHEKWRSTSVIRKIGTLLYEILADGTQMSIRSNFAPAHLKSCRPDRELAGPTLTILNICVQKQHMFFNCFNFYYT